MTNEFLTEQEGFWAGDFGEDYITRNTIEKLLSTNLWFFTNALKRIDRISSVIEFGPNIGANLVALNFLFPGMTLSGVEINSKAIEVLKKNLPQSNIINDSILNYNNQDKHDLTLIKGVLIHQDPSVLELVYQQLYDSSNKYILICEYYNPVPVALDYRGNKGKLFKRDFAGEFSNLFNDVSLIDYGFAYKDDDKAPQDDISWFLYKKDS